MFAPFPLKHLSLTLGIALALAALTPAADVEPEPPNDKAEEAAVPAVDLAKAKTDKKLAQQAALNQAASRKNLFKIGIAVHDYHDKYQRFATDIKDKKGKPLLSWRVALLPHLGQAKLYKQFKLDEPWDSKHNLKLLAKMPDVYRSPRVKLRAKGSTVYQVFTGRDAVFGRAKPMTIVSIPDGTSNTIMAIESSDAVPWTKPADIPFDRTVAPPDFGKAYGKKPLVVMFDGSPCLLNLEKIKAETLKNVIDPADGNTLGKDWSEGTEW